MLQASLSSHAQVILKPPVHFSILMVHRGTIIQFIPAETPVGVGLVPYPGTPMPGNAVPVRSIIIALDINELLSFRRLCRFLRCVPEARASDFPRLGQIIREST